MLMALMMVTLDQNNKTFIGECLGGLSTQVECRSRILSVHGASTNDMLYRVYNSSTRSIKRTLDLVKEA